MLVLASTKAEQATMSSREIAELVDARHNDVVSTIERLFGKGLLRSSRESRREATGGRPIDVYDLIERDTHLVIAGYSDEHRARVIDRWQELENAKAPINALNDPAALREMLLGYTEKVLALESTIQEQAPKVEYADALMHATGTTTIGDAAKSIGAPVMKMHKALKEKGVILKNNAPAAQYVTKGYFEESTTPYETKTKGTQIGHTARVTGKGIEFMRRFFVRHAALFGQTIKKKKERTLF